MGFYFHYFRVKYEFFSGVFAAQEYGLAEGPGASKLAVIFAKPVFVYSFASDFSAASPSDLIPRAGGSRNKFCAPAARAAFLQILYNCSRKESSPMCMHGHGRGCKDIKIKTKTIL